MYSELSQLVSQLDSDLIELKKIRQQKIRAVSALFEEKGWIYYNGEYCYEYEVEIVGLSPRFISPELAAELENFRPTPEREKKIYSVEEYKWIHWKQSLPTDEDGNFVYGQWKNHWIDFDF